MAKFTILEGDASVVYEILEPEVGIGRGAASDIQLATTAAGKHHAVVRRIRGRFKFVDLESLNGSLINGKARNQRWLRDGDEVRIGPARLQFDAEGAPDGPPLAKPARATGAPPAAARPAVAAKAPVPAVAAAASAAAPPAPPRRAVVEVTPPPAPVQPARARPAVAAPAAVQAAPPVRGRRSPLDDDGQYEDEGRLPRGAAKKEPPWAGIAIFAGAIVVLVFVFAQFAGTKSPNRRTLHDALNLARAGNFKEALQLAEQRIQPGPDHDALAHEMEAWRIALESKDHEALAIEAADRWMREIYQRTVNGEFRAKEPLSDDQAAQRAREWLLRYETTPKAMELLATPGEANDYFREILRRRPDAAWTSAVAEAEIRPAVEALVARRRYGQAIARIELRGRVGRLLMAKDDAEALDIVLRHWVEGLRARAQEEAARDLAEARALQRAGDRDALERKLEAMQLRYPRDMIGEAEAMRRVLQGR